MVPIRYLRVIYLESNFWGAPYNPCKMKFSVVASLPALFMTLLCMYTTRGSSDEVSSIAIHLAMFASWALSGLAVVVYRVARIIRYAGRQAQATRVKVVNLEPAPVQHPVGVF